MSTPLSRTEIVLSTDGKIIRRQITETQKELTAEHLAALTDQTTAFWPRLFNHPNTKPVTVGIAKNTATLSAQLSSIRLNTHYTVRDGVMTPAFDKTDEPVFDLNWRVPGDMKLLFVVELSGDGSFISTHLPAIDAQNRCHRLALGNLFDTGAICLGEFSPGRGSAQDVFNAAFDQFDKARWNDDLSSPSERAIASHLFRFQVAPDGGFTQLEPTARWQDVCPVIAPPILNFIKI